MEVGYAIGIDVGGTNMRAARISRSGDILLKKSIRGSRDPARAVHLIRTLIGEMGGPDARAIGVGIPGRVDGHSGEIISGGFLDLSGIDLKSELADFGAPVLIANDCSMALVGEARCGAARGAGNAVMMTIGTGIGGAIMENGQIVNGQRSAGQLGHLVVNMNGQQCLCGQTGCVETKSSGTALHRHMTAAGYGPEDRFEAALDDARAGKARGQRVMQAWAGPLKAAIQTLTAAFDPDVVVIGGGMGHASMQALGFLPEVQGWYQAAVRQAELGDDAGIIGCGLAALELVARRPPGKRLIMVNGVPASGKSGLAKGLAQRTGWPLLALDTIKNPFLELIDDVDRPFNRILGRASYKAIFSAIREAGPGSTFIVDAWFGFQPKEVLLDHLAMAGITDVLELWCSAPPEVIARRYLERAKRRLPGHPGPDYAPELVELAKRAGPQHLGPVKIVETTGPFDFAEVLAWINKATPH